MYWLEMHDRLIYYMNNYKFCHIFYTFENPLWKYFKKFHKTLRAWEHMAEITSKIIQAKNI